MEFTKNEISIIVKALQEERNYYHSFVADRDTGTVLREACTKRRDEIDALIHRFMMEG